MVPNDYECIIFGGFSVEQSKALDMCLKFTSCQDTPETLTELIPEQGSRTLQGQSSNCEKLKTGDFFCSQDFFQISNTDKHLILGHMGIH